MPNKSYSRNAEEKLEVVKYAEKHGNAAAVKHYDTDESNIRYWRKQKLVLATMPAKKRLLYSGEKCRRKVRSGQIYQKA